MVRTLFANCSTALSNAVVKGEISNISMLPVSLRQWMFKLFRLQQLLNNRNVIRLLCQPGFFDEFTVIDTIERHYDHCSITRCSLDASNGGFLLYLGTIFTANQYLAENIVELRLGVSEHGISDSDLIRRNLRAEGVANLLGQCRNLNRLHLISGYSSNVLSLYDLHTFPKAADISFFPALEHLSLMNYDSPWMIKQFPKQMFRSLKSLELHPIRCDQNIYRDILTCCQDTLISLDVIDNSDERSRVFPFPVPLPKLRSFSYERHSEEPVFFEVAEEHCSELTTTTLKLYLQDISDTLLAVLTKMIKHLRLHLRAEEAVDNVSEIVDTLGECIVELTIGGAELESRDYNRLLSNSPNLECLSICRTDIESMTLEKFFDDKTKATNLTELHIVQNLSPATLKSLFTNCCNVRCLYFEASDRLTDINQNLETWVNNGARPTTVVIHGLGDLLPETVYLLMKASGLDLKTMVLTVRVTDENVPVMCLNMLRNYCFLVERCLLFSFDPQEQEALEFFSLDGSFVKLKNHCEVDRRW